MPRAAVNDKAELYYAEPTTRKPTLTITLVGDHPIVREGMAQFLNAQPDLHLCCEAGDVREVLMLLPSCSSALVIVDFSLKRRSGLELITMLQRNSVRMALVAMSQYDEVVVAEQAHKPLLYTSYVPSLWKALFCEPPEFDRSGVTHYRKAASAPTNFAMLLTCSLP